MRSFLIILLLAVNSCSRPKVNEELVMHIVQSSYCSHNDPSWGVISNPGAIVISIKSGRATGQLLHIHNGERVELGSFDFDAGKHTFLSSTPTIESGQYQDAVDVSFVRDADQDSPGLGSKEVKLGRVVMVARTSDGQSIVEGPNVLYRIQRTKLEQDRWRPTQEQTLQSLIETSKNLDCEYIVLEIKRQR